MKSAEQRAKELVDKITMRQPVSEARRQFWLRLFTSEFRDCIEDVIKDVEEVTYTSEVADDRTG